MSKLGFTALLGDLPQKPLFPEFGRELLIGLEE
jgi:hypothetical protein